MKVFRFGITLLIASSVLTAHAQTLSGKWAGLWRVLDNGEKDRMYLDLKQKDNQFSGTMKTIGHIWQVHGSVTGDHFDVFFSPRDTKPRMTGVVANGKLRLSREGADFDAIPATPADDYPEYERLPLPAYHDVPANGLAQVPPMGWNSWNLFQSNIDVKTVRAIADAMVSTGMRDAGYVYINIDDTWQGVRDSKGNLSSNSKFPDMKALADYVHSKGLKFGIYSSPGPRTCAEYPGSYGHEVQDAKTFAAWGIDYLKYDWCGARMIYTSDALQAVYQKMGDALHESGRAIVFSLCEYGNGHVETWGSKVGGNLWRTTGDISDTWTSMIANIEKQAPTASYAGPGHWNDPDMLEIGNGGMTEEEYRTHMSLWAITAAPLLAGNDIRSMSPAIRKILMNAEVIAVDQDRHGRQASPSRHGDMESWVKPMADGSVAVVIVNLGASEANATLTAGELGLSGTLRFARNLWTHSEVGLKDGRYAAVIPSHGALMLRASAK
jgi:alpha-galactosidase